MFGTAIAIAQHAGGVFKRYSTPIVVSLVASSAQGEGTASVRRKDRKTRDISQRQTEPDIDRQQEAPREMSVDRQAAPLVPAAGQEPGNGSDEESVGSQQVVSAEAGREGNAGIGLIAREQWAAIEAAIERAKNYPRLARERGMEGVVHLRFKVKPSGAVDTVEIVKSSGYDILDGASVRTVYRAAPLPYVSGWIEVPIAYVLK